MQKQIRILSLFLIISVLAMSFAGCGSKPASEPQAAAGDTAAKQETAKTIDVAGVLVPSQTVNVTTKVTGQVKTINVNAGSTVNAGDVLIVIDTKELGAQLSQVEAALRTAEDQAAQAKLNMDEAASALNTTRQLLNDQEAQAKLNFEAAELAYNRMLDSYKSSNTSSEVMQDMTNKYELAKKQYEMAKVDTGSSAQSQLLAASTKYDLAKAQYNIASGSALNQARAAVNTIRVQVDNATIKSPISGVVTNKNISVGEIASTAAQLLTIADTTNLKLKGTVSQEVLPAIKENQEVAVVVDIYPGKTFKGVITSVGPMSVGTGAYFPIEITIGNPGELKAGLSAHTTITQ